MDGHRHLLDALAAVDPARCSYQEWVDVGMALHESGFSWEDWDGWSRRDPARYHEGECERKWAGFGRGMGEHVKSGTVIAMAEAAGWRQPSAGTGEALDWDSVVMVGPDPTWVEEEDVGDVGADVSPTTQLYDYLRALFDDDDFVGYATESYDKDGRAVPTKGVWTRTAGELRSELAKTDDLAKVIGDWRADVGAWIRFNPLDGHGVANANVTEYRYALVESDELEVGRQLPMLRAMNLPCAAIVSSAGKSVHAIVKVDAGRDYDLYRKRVERLYAYCRQHGFQPDSQNKNPSRLSRLPGVTRGGRVQALLATDVGAESWDAWEEWVAESEDDLPDTENLLDRLRRDEPLSEPVIGDEGHGLLRRGHKMLVQGPSKAGKSMLLIELAIAVASGGEWMGYPCRRGRVLYVNLEIDRASMDERFRRVARDPQTRWVTDERDPALAGIDVWNLRGKACPMDQLAPRLIRRMGGRDYSMVIVDPLYKVITGDENSASEMAAFCNQFDKVAAQTGASIIYCHHHSKGSQGAKRAIDRGSGSGVFGRDPDAILDVAPLEVDEKRERQLDGTTCWRVSATLREFKSPAPIDLFYRYPVHLMDRAGELAKLKVDGEQESWRERKQRRDDARSAKVESDQAEKVRLMSEAYEACREDGVRPTRRAMLERIGEFDGKPVSDGQLRAWTKPGKAPWSPFEVRDDPDGVSVVTDAREGSQG